MDGCLHAMLFFLFLCWLWPLSQPFLWIISYSNQTVAHHQTSWFLSSYLNELSYTYHFSKILQNIAQLHSWSHTNSIRAGVGPNLCVQLNWLYHQVQEFFSGSRACKWLLWSVLLELTFIDHFNINQILLPWIKDYCVIYCHRLIHHIK